jgi:FtsP/CotA-like multicopper oxidase with cupredoxin domain
VGVLCLAIPLALGGLSDVIEALNALIALEGPVPGSIARELPVGLEPANVSAVEGGLTGTLEDAGENINKVNFRDPLLLDIKMASKSSLKFDIPTGAVPSPLFGALPFTQQMLREEEFGLLPMPDPDELPEANPFPRPLDAGSSPDGQALDDFLAQSLFPYPTRETDSLYLNPWRPDIEAFLGRQLAHPPADGRPPGEDWAHQRWEEFTPEVYFQTAQAGARTNQGLRDESQNHGYSAGEFGPPLPGSEGETGLYHNTVGVGEFNGTTEGILVKFHPNMPVQKANALWTFDGTLPPKLLMARYGEEILFRHYNALPIDPAANFGFGLHTIATHEHNGHNPAESDGFTQAFFFPGQYYDYRWPMVLAGHDSINTDATDERAGAPDGNGGITRIPGNWRETMSSHWFHDHMLDFTAQNIYKGNVAAMNYYSAVDRGNEAIDDGVNLRLPSGTALDWGNRDYDVHIMIADKSWDSDGQLFFNIFNTDGFLGDRVLTNWLWQPYFNVRARRYRFRLLNSAVSRYFRFALVKEVRGTSGQMEGPSGSGVSYDRVPFHMIANDGNIMEHAVSFAHGVLPTQAIAERYDIIVDFSPFAPGTKLYLVNLLEHRNGKRPHEPAFLDEVLSGKYRAELHGDEWRRGDPCVGKILEFSVKEYTGTDLSMNPADFVATLPNGQEGKKMIPLPEFTQEEINNAIHRTFEFGRSSGTDSEPWTIKTDGGSGFNMDPRRLSAAPNLGEDGKGQVEIWHLRGNGGWSHPIHIHFEEGQILKRGGAPPPEWEQWARKDVFRIGRMADSGESVDIAIRFREFLGTFMEHCHNTQHEDHSMLLRWDLEAPGQVRVMPTPMPTWDGVGYVPSYALPTFRTGDLAAAAQKEFFRGDANSDGTLNITDPIFVLVFLFASGATPTCLAAADSNDDELIGIADPIADLLNLFHGRPLPEPWLVAGVDPTPGIGCGAPVIPPAPGN